MQMERRGQALRGMRRRFRKNKQTRDEIDVGGSIELIC